MRLLEPLILVGRQARRCCAAAVWRACAPVGWSLCLAACCTAASSSALSSFHPSILPSYPQAV
eukprot:4628853-Pleurochrysis_carterae.AAC.2